MLILAVLASTGAPAADPAPEAVELVSGTTKLKAYLFRPEGKGPFPAVVALHGCAGLSGNSGPVRLRYRDWGQRLVEQGFVVLYPDSFGSRGLPSQCTVRDRVARASRERVSDAVAARQWLQKQDFVERDRVSLMGWQNGGVAVLWTVRRRLAVEDSPDFRAAVALYPGCRRLAETAWSARVPTLVLVGSADDWTPAAPCEQMVAGARGRSAQASIMVYPGAYAEFDHPNKPIQVLHGLAFTADGSGRAHSGTNAAARADAMKRVPEWFSR